MNVDAPRKRWTGDRLDGLDEKVGDGFAQVDKGFEEVAERFEKVDARFEKVDARFEKVDARFEKVEAKIDGGIKELRDKVDSRFDTLDAKFDKKFDWLMGILLVSVLGILGAVIGPNVL
jgi:hypothetical protein